MESELQAPQVSVIRPISREEFQRAVSLGDPKLDGFARTSYLSKCDMLQAWDRTLGLCEGNPLEVCAAITVTLSKRQPIVANLQLLHTFSRFRRRGYAATLCTRAVALAHNSGAQYFRVSAEPESVEFYRKVGFKFWGKQKSGCQLSIFRLAGPTLADAVYSASDPVIQAALYGNRKGCLVERFPELR